MKIRKFYVVTERWQVSKSQGSKSKVANFEVTRKEIIFQIVCLFLLQIVSPKIQLTLVTSKLVNQKIITTLVILFEKLVKVGVYIYVLDQLNQTNLLLAIKLNLALSDSTWIYCLADLSLFPLHAHSFALLRPSGLWGYL